MLEDGAGWHPTTDTVDLSHRYEKSIILKSKGTGTHICKPSIEHDLFRYYSIFYKANKFNHDTPHK